jgi:predicted site-specific integrase-resolvase
MEGFYKRKKASELLHIHHHTLTKLASINEIETLQVGSHKFYNVNKYLINKGVSNTTSNKNVRRNICYCRVSSSKQKEDLQRQIQYMKNKFPSYEVIYDIASGLNYNRKGLKKILNYALNNELNEIVIAYKDRLTRFGYELIEWLIKEKSNGYIKILNNDEELTPQEEISKDILAIMNIYVAKNNGLRKYKNKIKQELFNIN